MDKGIIGKSAQEGKLCKAMYERSFNPFLVGINAMIFGLSHVPEQALMLLEWFHSQAIA